MEADSDQSKIDWCLEKLRAAKSDNEKMAALRLVATATNSKEMSKDVRGEFLEAIGPKFLTRLLKTKSAPEGCTVDQFKSIALSILSGLFADPELILHVHMHKNLEVINEIIQSNPNVHIEDREKMTMVDDCYELIQQLAASEVGQNLLLTHYTTSAVCQCYIEDMYGSDKAEELLRLLISRMGRRMWSSIGHGRDLQHLMCHLTEQFNILEDQSKFELCEFLSLVIRSIPSVMIIPCIESAWLPVLVKCLRQILTSKLGEAQREPSLKMTSVLVDRLDVSCLLPPNTPDSKLLLVMTHLSCIEVRMILENLPYDQIVGKSDLLCSCYQLLENIIGHMTTAPSLLLDEKQILQLHSAMVGAFNAILCFLKEISQSEDSLKPDPVVIATVRVLGVWLSEETTALREGTCEVLPFLLHLCSIQVASMAKLQDENKDSEKLKSESQNSSETGIETDMSDCHIRSEQNEGKESESNKLDKADNETDYKTECQCDNKCEKSESLGNNIYEKNKKPEDSQVLDTTEQKTTAQDDNVENLSSGATVSDCVVTYIDAQNKSDVLSRIDLVRFLLPALCHLSVEEKPRQILLAENVQTWLVQYLVLSMEKARLDGDESAKRGVEVTCSVFLNLTVLEGPLVKEDPDLLYLSCRVMEIVPDFANKEDSLFLWANLVTLGLFLIRHQATTNTASAELKSRYFSTVMTFVKCPYTSKQLGQGHVLCLTEMYGNAWEDLSQLWQLTTQAVCECIPKFPELGKAILSAGLLPYFVKLMVKVEGRQVSDEFKDGAFSVITAALKDIPQAKEIVKSSRGSRLAQMYRYPAVGKLLE